ncbi:hypothetical protein EON64_21200, partial [archaeon]
MQSVDRDAHYPASHLSIGTKRKAQDLTAAPSSSAALPEPATPFSDAQNLLELDVDSEVDRAVQRVRQGTHPSLQAQATVLEQERRKLVEAAHRHKEMQMLNVQQLFDYEVQDAQALY